MENGRPSHARARPGGTAPPLLRTLRRQRPEAGGISVLRARGTVDESNAAEFCQALAEHIEDAGRTGEHPVLDLTEAYLGCPDGVRCLDRATGALAFSGRAPAVVQPRPHVRDVLRTAGLPGIQVHATLASALHALEARTPPHSLGRRAHGTRRRPLIPGRTRTGPGAVESPAPAVQGGGSRSGSGRASPFPRPVWVMP